MWCLARFKSTADTRAFWSIAASESGRSLFEGCLMVPGIKAIQPLSSGYKQIINTDGTRHRERTITYTDRSLVLEMDQVIASARSHGYARVVLDTLPSMSGAQRIYERLGFRDIEPYRLNPVEGAWYMCLTL